MHFQIFLSFRDLRQDPASGWQFVNECVEVQVTSAQEAMEVFHQGQKRRRVAHTTLNAQSSRSHSVFNIRLVKAQSFSDGEVCTQLSISICRYLQMREMKCMYFSRRSMTRHQWKLVN